VPDAGTGTISVVGTIVRVPLAVARRWIHRGRHCPARGLPTSMPHRRCTTRSGRAFPWSSHWSCSARRLPTSRHPRGRRLRAFPTV